MKTKTQTTLNLRHLANAAAVSLSQPDAAVNAFRPSSSTGGSTAKRPASQHPELRQNNPNPGKALPAVAGGASGATNMDLHFPQFPAIASRRDAPLTFAGHPSGRSESAAQGYATSSEPSAKSPGAPKTGHKTELLFQHKPLLRDTGIND